MWIDTEKLRASWENDRYGYFDGEDHPNVIKNRIARFGEWIKQGIPIQAPEVSLSDDGHVIFTNGRHRFVWMLQHGIKSLPVAVPPEYVDEIKNQFGVASLMENALPVSGSVPWWVSILTPLTNMLMVEYKSEGWSWTTGGCFAFAAAFKNAFGGEIWGEYCLANDNRWDVDHAVVKLNDKFYDYEGEFIPKPDATMKPKDNSIWPRDDFMSSSQQRALTTALKTGKLPKIKAPCRYVIRLPKKPTARMIEWMKNNSASTYSFSVEGNQNISFVLRTAIESDILAFRDKFLQR